MAKKNKVEILALIDRSGSMHSIMKEAVGAFNTFIEEQRKAGLDDKVKVTLAAFDNKYEVVFDRVDIDDLPELTVDQVQPRGMTALNDAIGNLITGAKHPDRDTVLLIQTDGWENASQEFTGAQIKDLVKEREEAGWDVNFIGAGLNDEDVKAMGEGYGFALDKSISVKGSADGMSDFKDHISGTTLNYRSSKSQ